MAWITWDHPNMPWDGADLWVAEVSPSGQLINPAHIAGGPDESIFQPEWDLSGSLYFTSDRNGWWNLYRYDGDEVEPLSLTDKDIGAPQWMLGYSRYTFLPDGRIACIYDEDGLHHLGLIDRENKSIEPIESPYTSFYLYALQSDEEGRLWFVGGSFTQEHGIAWLDPHDQSTQVIYQNAAPEIDPGYISIGSPITFPSEAGNTYALYYPPTNRDFVGKPSERPPLLVFSHGGPTSMARPQLQLEIQYWTTRGIAVVDVNYSGSSGFGRAYRDRLKGEWGILDVADCVNAARYLATQGEVDGARLLIRGGSAGGYITLCALTFSDLFAAGASYYGVADIEMLAKETHKFEAHYLDSLVGPYPEQKRLYIERSPIHFTDRLSCPIIIFQGLDDKVVPPSQAEVMVTALEEKGLPYAYVTFEGESHGFSRFETIVRAMEAELYFYSQILGFDLAQAINSIPIANRNN
jgi:dipeptidyl aminopeptidase/acylaminoacyl peptidase